MPEFLDLRGKRAAAAFLQARDDPAADPAPDGEEKPVPFDGGVALGLLSVEEIAVLDEQEAAGDKVRDLIEVLVHALRELSGVDLFPAPVVDPDAGLVLLAVDRKRAEMDKAHQPVRPFCLVDNLEVVLAERSDELWQLRIAEPLVIGPTLRKLDRIARPARDREAHAPVEPVRSEEHTSELQS